MALSEMYFDESEDTKHKLLCVAGYLLKQEKRMALEHKWNEVLQRERLPYFRMVDCAHGNGVFEGILDRQRIKIQTELFDLLKQHIETGISISFDLRFSHLCPSAKAHGISTVQPYTLCAYFCLMRGRQWAEENSFDGKISYIFESGHAHQTQANHVMNEIFSVPELRALYRYEGHSFLSKERSVALQCGDILAWQWSKFIKDRLEGKRKPRADLLSLLERPLHTIHFDENSLTEFGKVVQKTNDEIEIRKKLSELSRI